MNENITKSCNKCNRELPTKMFTKVSASKDGLAYRCKSCVSEWYQNNRTRLLEKYRLYEQKNRKKVHDRHRRYNQTHKKQNREQKRLYRNTLVHRFHRWKTNARDKNLLFKLTISDLAMMDKKCYYTGIPLTFETHKFNTISLDRVNSSGNYTKDNVVFCCQYINIMKNNLTCNQFLYSCSLVAKYNQEKIDDMILKNSIVLPFK